YSHSCRPVTLRSQAARSTARATNRAGSNLRLPRISRPIDGGLPIGDGRLFGEGAFPPELDHKLLAVAGDGGVSVLLVEPRTHGRDGVLLRDVGQVPRERLPM